MKDLHREPPDLQPGQAWIRADSDPLQEISETLKRIDMALMHQAGLGTLTTTRDEKNGGFILDFTPNETPSEPVEMRQPGTTKPLRGTTVWEFTPPPPHSGWVIIGAADSYCPYGVRFSFEAKGVGGERVRIPLRLDFGGTVNGS